MSDGLRLEYTPYFKTESTIKIGYNKEEPRGRTSLCSKIILVICVAALIFSIAMIVIGSMHAVPLHKSIYESGCPGEKMLPWYLVIGGLLTIALVLGRIILIQMLKKCQERRNEKEKSVGLKCCRLSFLSLYDILALACSAIWLIAGTKFLLGIYDKVNYEMHRPNEDTCSELVFRFSFYTIVVGWIILALFTIILICTRFCQCCCFLCCKPCRKDNPSHL